MSDIGGPKPGEGAGQGTGHRPIPSDAPLKGAPGAGSEPGLASAGFEPHAAPGDASLRPDPAGVHDPLRGLGSQAQGVGGAAPGAAQDTRDRIVEAASGVKEQIRERVSGIADQIQDRLGGAAGGARERASGAVEGARTWAADVHQQNLRRIDDITDRGVEGLNRGRTAVEQFVQENPLLVGVVGVAAGLLLGALLPRTRQEDRQLGPLADEVRDQGMRYAREFTERGRTFVETALDPENVTAAARKAAEEPAPANDRTARPV